MNFALDRDPFSYLRDDSVPSFSATEVICVMDARCSLCARGATWIARNDKAQEFTIIPMQSEVGSALLEHYGMSLSDPTSWLYLENGRAYASIDAFIRVGQRLGGVRRGLIVLRVMPKPLQDFLYRGVAQNRYKIFGSTDMCALPDFEVQKRLLQ